MGVNYFNIHDIVKFKINDTQKRLFKNLLGNPFEEYSNYHSNEITDENLDFIVNVVDKLEKRPDCFILDDKYYIDKGYIYTTDSYKIAQWIIEIIKENNSYTLNIKANRTARLFISGFFIDFFIQYILTQKGYSTVHSSGVSHNGNSYLFSGRGGSGKTSIAIHLVSTEESFQFMGDDFIILKDEYAFPFITPLNLFTYNINSFLINKFNNRQKCSFFLKNILFMLTFGYAKFFTKLNPMLIFPEKISSHEKISNIFIILPTNQEGIHEANVTQLGKKEVIQYLVNNMKMDSWYIPKYFIQYGFLFPTDEFSTYWQDYENNLINNLPKITNCYKVVLPKLVSWQRSVTLMNLGDTDD